MSTKEGARIANEESARFAANSQVTELLKEIRDLLREILTIMRTRR